VIYRLPRKASTIIALHMTPGVLQRSSSTQAILSN
jgi:hypothetical protein